MSFVIALFLSIFLFSILFISTPNGLAASPDSVAYIKGALGFINGHGYDYVSAEWPPLYPSLLILFSNFTNNDVLLASRILQSALFSLNFLLISQILFDYFYNHRLLSTLFAAVISTQPAILYIHFYAWSEPTLLFFILLDFLLLKRVYSKNYKKNFYIELFLILISSLAFLTRFAGITVAALNFIIIFLLCNKPTFFEKFYRALSHFIIPIFIFIPWTFHRAVQNGPATQRTIEYHSLSIDSIKLGLETIGKWFLFGNSFAFLQNFYYLIGSFVLIFLFTLTIIIYFPLIKNIQHFNPLTIPSITISLLILNSYIFIYLVFIISAISFVDNKVILDDRILSPIFICLFLLFFALFFNIKKYLFKLLSILFIVFLLFTSYINIRTWVLISYFNGIELSDTKFNNRPIYKFLLHCSNHSSIFADNPWNFDLIFKSKVMWLPRSTLFNTGHVNKNFQLEIESLANIAEIVVIENPDNSLIATLNSMSTFNKIYDSSDGIIWINNTKSPNLCNYIN